MLSEPIYLILSNSFEIFRAASTALSATGLILACACLSAIPGPVIPSKTGFLCFKERFDKRDPVTFAITSSSLVWPFIIAPRVITASTFFFYK